MIDICVTKGLNHVISYCWIVVRNVRKISEKCVYDNVPKFFVACGAQKWISLQGIFCYTYWERHPREPKCCSDAARSDAASISGICRRTQ